MKKPKQKRIEEIVEFVMNTANGIDDYNWGQEQFEKDLREKLNNYMEKEQQEFIAEHYDTIRDILESYKNNEIGLNEAIHCIDGIIEKFNKTK